MECPYCKEKLVVVSGIQVHAEPKEDCPLLGQITVTCKRNIAEDKEYLSKYLKSIGK